MIDPTRLVVFDCDGTLVDSQHMIVSTMHETFEQLGLEVLHDDAVRAIVGLSLVEAMEALVPQAERDFHEMAAEKYKANFYNRRTRLSPGPDPLYPGVLEVLTELNDGGYLLGVATGNSVRGLDRVMTDHAIGHHFVTLQTADKHPSKPHPSMIHTAVAEAGSAIDRVVMVGDTSFDMMMARNAGCGGIGVTWGYHPEDELRGAGAAHVVTSFYDVPQAVRALIG